MEKSIGEAIKVRLHAVGMSKAELARRGYRGALYPLNCRPAIARADSGTQVGEV